MIAPAAIRTVEEAGDGNRISLTLADESRYEELRDFRAAVFRDELRTQSADYLDVFNDYFSKNVVLHRGSHLRGAVRLAYSHDADAFFTSYLTVERESRNSAVLAPLLGAVLYLMRENRIAVVRAHSTVANLDMYLSMGCKPTGPPFKKYGFTCEWTPVEYALDTHPGGESQLVRRVSRHLRGTEAKWGFPVRVIPCRHTDEYDRVLCRLIWTRQIFGIVPMLGGDLDAIGRLPWFVRRIDVVRFVETASTEGHDFAYYNRRFDPTRAMCVRAGGSLERFARTYGMLLGRRVIPIGDSSVEDQAVHVRDAWVLMEDVDRDLPAIVSRRFPESRLELFNASTPEEMSARLFRRYLATLGPAHDPFLTA